MRSNKRPPPKPLTPGISRAKNSRRNKRILSKRNLLNRNRNPPPPRPRNASNHISPIKLNPISGVPISRMKAPPQGRHPPNQLRQNRNLKSPNIPRMHQLPKNIPPPPAAHPGANLIKIRPGDRGIRGKQIPPLGNGGPRLNRPPVVSNKMNRPTPSPLHHPNKVPNQLPHPVSLAPSRRRRLPTPPNVIPNDPKPPPKLPNNPIPNGRIVRIPMNQQHSGPLNQPINIDSQPNPTTLNPHTTHKATVAAPRETACAKLSKSTSPRSSGDRALPSGGRCRRFKSCRGRTSHTCRNRR